MCPEVRRFGRDGGAALLERCGAVAAGREVAGHVRLDSSARVRRRCRLVFVAVGLRPVDGAARQRKRALSGAHVRKMKKVLRAVRGAVRGPEASTAVAKMRGNHPEPPPTHEGTVAASIAEGSDKNRARGAHVTRTGAA
ncbi:hypothetical protein GCM10009830_35060 [Glycomyces endophyticus]|uniref:Uncharacterized protein n=1 Tax=Glycomyces endophyticus TaxID=480996 RepID=A0ABP4TAB8_9ACTN